jgi:uncharacterized protein HemY
LWLQARCYARSVDVVGELVRTIKNGDRSGADGADRVLWAIDSLPALEACSDIASLRNDLSDFGSSAEARRQAALRTHLEQLRVLVALRPNASSEGRAQRLRAEAEQLGQPSLEALAVFYYGQLLSEQGHRSRARELFENAVALAERADNRSLMAKAAIAALGTFGPEETDSATKWEDIARQALAEIGTGELLADFHDTLGKLFAGRRDYARARVELEQAVDLRERILGARHPTVSRSLLTLGDVLRAQGNDVAARSVYARALTAAEDAWGEQHPELAPILERLAILAERTEELSTAQAFRQRAQSL